MVHPLIQRVPWLEIIRFGVMGATSSGIYLAMMIPLKWLVPAALWLVALIAYLLSMIANYFLQRRITFRSHRQHREAVSRFLVVQLVGLGLNSALLELLVTRQHGNFWIGQGLAILVVAVWSYGAQKFWVFMKWGERSAS